MASDDSSMSEPSEYPDLPDSAQSSPEWREAEELKQHAEMMQGRLALGCCLFWLDGGGYLLTALPPMGDVRGSESWMRIYTAEHLVTIRGRNLDLLAWAMKQQRIDDLRITRGSSQEASQESWAILSITAQERDEE
ncbi:MAG: hypothetical protein INR62_10175 [Rhodospirillales bacterium]|nr:hypothetical protein [Acetobacter sp.]